ncbi:hypothetical protein SLEP1_g58288 [Rubroshorea leprosula]|uniref:Uncharacterized protein n=1 Tax=Rubroshorea leprosula TaxID=152421 RepID=A0AAV5MNT1_9ROSI|nr:hypothetical protein SLEP1_g58288 [Rubroshorea leprosula]
MLKDNIVKCIPLGQSVVGRLSQDIVAASSNLSVRFWLKSCPKNCSNGSYKCGNLLLHMPTHISMPQKLKCYYFAVEEINCFQVKRKLKDYAMDSQIVRFEDGIDLVTIIKGTSFYCCGKYHDCCQITCHLHLLNSRSYMNQIDRWLNAALSPVMLSSLNY